MQSDTLCESNQVSGCRLDTLIQRGWDDPDARAYLHHYMALAIERGEVLSPPLRKLAAFTLRGTALKAISGGKTDWYRNAIIIIALHMLRNKGIPPKRNAASDTRSGSDIVSEILGKLGGPDRNLTYSGVAAVWDTYGDNLTVPG